MKTTTSTNEIKTRKPVKMIAAGAIAVIIAATTLLLSSSSNSNKNAGMLSGTRITASADSTKAGRFGDLAYWTLDGTGRLIISGTGAMPDYINDDKTPWRDFRSDIKAVIIEDGITNVGTYAFSYCTHLTSVKLGKGITTIGREAFNGCLNLKKADIPEGVKTIGNDAFHLCSALESVTIPSTVTTIENDAFFGCKNCKSVDIKVTDPTKLTWEESKDDFMPGKATKCNVPAAKIGDYTNTFGDTVNVTFVDNKCGENATWELDDNGKLTISGTGAIFDFGETDRGPWKTVDDKIKTVEIQDGITKIGSDAFYYCNNITSVTIAGSVTTVAKNAFNYCTSLSSVTLSEGLTTINKKAFAHCTLLTSVTIPSTVTKIDTDAFLSCKGCKDVNLLVTDTAKLTWNAKMGNDFMSNKATKCHVASDKVDDFTAKFGSTVNVTFVAAE